MDANSKASSFDQSTSDSLINHMASKYASSSSSGTRHNAEEFQEHMGRFFTKIRVLTSLVYETVCDIHGHTHKRLGQTMDLYSPFEIDFNDFDPNHRHVLEQARRLYSEMVLARKAVMDKVDALDGELDKLVTRSVTARQELEAVMAARSLQSGAQPNPVNTYSFLGSLPYDLQYVGAWVDSPSQYPVSPAPGSLAVSPLSGTSETSGRTSSSDRPYRSARERPATPWPGVEGDMTDELESLLHREKTKSTISHSSNFRREVAQHKKACEQLAKFGSKAEGEKSLLGGSVTTNKISETPISRGRAAIYTPSWCLGDPDSSGSTEASSGPNATRKSTAKPEFRARTQAQ